LSLLLALLAAAQPAGFAVEERSELLEFSYAWPAEAEAIALLRAHLAGEMARARAGAARYARTDRSESAAEGRPFEAHHYGAGWGVVGNGPVLLSIAAEISSFTGGVHGNRDFAAILWDRAAGRRLDTARLLGPGALESLRPRFCAALDAMRADRRGSEPLEALADDDPFTACPALARHAMAPADRDGNGRFETLRVMLPPYAAGAYAEGEYVIDLAFESEDLAAIPDGLRSAFELPGERRAPLPDE